MFFIKEAYATVWKIQEVRENYTRVRFSTSEKDLQGNYINSTWFGMFTGKAHAKAESLQEKDRIQITSGKINNKREQKDGNWVTYTNVYVFDFEMSEPFGQQQSAKPPKVKESKDYPDEEDEDVMPF